MFLFLSLIVYAIFFGIGVFLNEQFFDYSFVNLTTIYVAIAISYYLVQEKNEKRILRNKCEDLISEIKSILDRFDHEYVLNFDKDLFLITQTRLNNKILVLTKILKVKFKFQIEVDNLNSDFENLIELFGNHMNDLVTVEKDIISFRNKIDAKLDKIILKLFDIKLK